MNRNTFDLVCSIMTDSNEHSKSRVIVIGAGFAGISSATALAAKGHQVTVLERHNQPGGRCRVFEAEGYRFDMGPSWYWMPDVFEDYFKQFGADIHQALNLIRLDPSYKVWFSDAPWDVEANFEKLQAQFEALETGAGEKLKAFMEEASVKYTIGMGQFVRKTAHSPIEFAQASTLYNATKLTLFKSFSDHVRSYFKHPKILQLMEFPVLFLGAKPEQTPALYSLMNYADTMLGTWYPMGGMHEIVKAMVRVAEDLGVKFVFNAEVQEIATKQHAASGVLLANGDFMPADAVVAGADYHHVEQHLLPKRYRRYDESYWDTRTMSPSSLLFYVGVNRRVPGLRHHNLFFDTPFGPHAETIYDSKTWPTDPLFYVSAPSVTDASVAPEGCENMFFLIPVAPGLKDEPGLREQYFQEMTERLTQHTGVDISEHIVYKRSYAHEEFTEDYSAYKGNAYGLANTLKQTAFWKPKMRSKLKGLFFTGQLTTPGPGVPPSLISGDVAANEVHRYIRKKTRSSNEPETAIIG